MLHMGIDSQFVFCPACFERPIYASSHAPRHAPEQGSIHARAVANLYIILPRLARCLL